MNKTEHDASTLLSILICMSKNSRMKQDIARKQSVFKNIYTVDNVPMFSTLGVRFQFR